MMTLQAGASFSNAKGQVLTIVSFDDSRVVVYPEGGGFQLEIPRETFLEEFTPWVPGAPVRALVTTDGFPRDVSFEAYVEEGRWNGWVIPYFTKAEGLRMLPHVFGLTYDAREDAFVYIDECAGDDSEAMVFSAAQIETVDGIQTLYGIGAGFWTWETAVARAA